MQQQDTLACRHKPKFHRYAKTTPLPVLMTNNSSERVYLTPNIPQIPNIIPIDTCTYVEEEQPSNQLYPLANSGIFEIGESQELNIVDV